MKNTYNKGKYRSYEYAKHIRPYLKRVGNKKWRRTAKPIVNDIEQDEELAVLPKSQRQQKKKEIAVRFIVHWNGGKKHKYTSRYRTLRDARNAMRRKHVTEAMILSKKK